MRVAAMFPKVDALPGAETQPAVLKWNREVNARQSAAHVRGHIVGTFGGMDEKAIAVGHDARHPRFEIAPHVGISIFLDEQRGRSVPHVQSAQPIL